MVKMPLVSVIVLLYTLVTNVSAIRCLQCDDARSPFECNKIIDCWPSEECFLRQYIKNNGDILYSMGCMPIERCEFRKRSSSDLVTCLQCCNSDYCNVQGCHTAPAPMTQRGPKCLACQDLSKADDCLVAENCGPGNVCGLLHAAGQYTSRCISKEQCEAILKVSSVATTDGVYTGCNLCCTEDFCNDKCRNITITTENPSTSIMVPTHPTFVTSSALKTNTSGDHQETTPDVTTRFWTWVTDTSKVHTFTFGDGKTIAFNKGVNGDLTHANCLLLSKRGISPGPCSDSHSFICENENFIKA